jgi:hypothetical protein
MKEQIDTFEDFGVNARVDKPLSFKTSIYDIKKIFEQKYKKCLVFG